MGKQTISELHNQQRRAAKLMKRIMVQIRVMMDEKLQPYGATVAQIRLLSAIRNAPGSSGAQLARQCEVTPQTVQVLIRRAQGVGWVIRGKDSINGRIVTTFLTPGGEQLLEVADGLMKQIEARVWRGVGQTAVDQFNEVLEKCMLNTAEN